MWMKCLELKYLWPECSSGSLSAGEYLNILIHGFNILVIFLIFFNLHSVFFFLFVFFFNLPGKVVYAKNKRKRNKKKSSERKVQSMYKSNCWLRNKWLFSWQSGWGSAFIWQHRHFAYKYLICNFNSAFGYLMEPLWPLTWLLARLSTFLKNNFQ